MADQSLERRLVDKALDAIDWDYGGDMAEYLGRDWRRIFRTRILAAVVEIERQRGVHLGERA